MGIFCKTWWIHVVIWISMKTQNFCRYAAILAWFALGTAAIAGPAVDKYGQSTSAIYPVKIHSDAELAKDVASEPAYYAGLKPPKRDSYGGMLGSKATLGLKATGYFHVEKHAKNWRLVDPAGNLYYVLGVAANGLGMDYTYVTGRKDLFEWLPPVDSEFKSAYYGPDNYSFYVSNLIRKYKKPYVENEFLDRTLQHEQKWGFNTGGPMAGWSPAYIKRHFVSVSSLPAEGDGVPLLPGISRTFDPFDAKIRSAIDRKFAAELPKAANDPLVLGYVSTNEPLYEDIPRVVPTLNGTYTCKRRLVASLMAHYKTIDAFNAAWGLHAIAFDGLSNAKLIPTTPAAQRDIQEFTGLFLETYFKLMADTFHKYDKHHMLLGCRLQSGTINSKQLCGIAGKYLDIMTFNYYTYAPDADFLNRIYKWTGRPLLLSEYYYVSTAESGLTSGNNDMKTEALRGKAYRHYVEQSAALPYVLGAQWFALVDEAATGWMWDHENGEHANTGLINVTDRPYKDMLAHMMRTNYGIYDVVLGKRKPYAFTEDPRFAPRPSGIKTLPIARATGPVPIDGTGVGFPGLPAEPITGKRTAVGRNTGGGASMKACWDNKNLYLLVSVSDTTPMMNLNTGDTIWQGDGLEVFIGYDTVDQDGTLVPTDKQVLLSGAKVDGGFHAYVNHGTIQDTIKLISVPNVNGAGYLIEAAIPFAALGFTPSVNQQIRFDIAVDDSILGKERVSQYVWNGDERDSGDRTHWGRAKFIR